MSAIQDPHSSGRARPSWRARALLVALAASVVVVAALCWMATGASVSPSPSTWGWNRPEPRTANLASTDDLNGLAYAAEEWFLERPDDAPGLARRLGEFRQGCASLILAHHAPLPRAERERLVQECRAWAARLDQHRADLESGADALAVRAAADETVRRLASALRDHAPQGIKGVTTH